MKIRQAKKILFTVAWKRRFLRLRPPYRDGGRICLPSCHDLDIVVRAKTRWHRYVKGHNNRRRIPARLRPDNKLIL